MYPVRLNHEAGSTVSCRTLMSHNAEDIIFLELGGGWLQKVSF
jgi:hypothetical protein